MLTFKLSRRWLNKTGDDQFKIARSNFWFIIGYNITIDVFIFNLKNLNTYGIKTVLMNKNNRNTKIVESCRSNKLGFMGPFIKIRRWDVLSLCKQ